MALLHLTVQFRAVASGDAACRVGRKAPGLPAFDPMSHHLNPRARLTPLMRGVIDRMTRAGRPPMHTLTPQQARAFYELGSGVLDLQPHKMARVEDLALPTRDGHTLSARLWVPHAAAHPHGPDATGTAMTLPVLLYYHGGGFTIGSVATHEVLCRHLAHLAQCAVVAVDYRLAPEHRFPTAVHDAWDSLLALKAQYPHAKLVVGNTGALLPRPAGLLKLPGGCRGLRGPAARLRRCGRAPAGARTEPGHLAADDERRVEPGTVQREGAHRRRGRLAVCAGDCQHVAMPKDVVGQPLRSRHIVQIGVENCLNQGVAAGDDIANDETVGFELQLIRRIALNQLDAERLELVRHRWINVGIAAGDLVAGLARKRRKAAHEGAANAENVDVHETR